VLSDLIRVTERLKKPAASVPDEGDGDRTSASPRHRLPAARFTPDRVETMLARLRGSSRTGM
jgi:hypothetical protein